MLWNIQFNPAVVLCVGCRSRYKTDVVGKLIWTNQAKQITLLAIYKNFSKVIVINEVLQNMQRFKALIMETQL